VRIGRRGRGFVAEAACFYVWDEDPGELLRTASELARQVGAGPLPMRWEAGGAGGRAETDPRFGR
jgi:hypothetical protein